MKANGLAPAAPQIAKLMGPDTALVTGINGIPYWYFYGLDGPWRDRVVESVDPGGKLWEILPPRQAIGCIVYPAAEVMRPGVIEHTYGNRFTLGEPDGSKSARVEALSQMLVQAGLKAPVRNNIRDEIWVKLWGNLAFNPLSALTASTLDRLAFRPDLRAIARAMMEEAAQVAEALGVRFPSMSTSASTAPVKWARTRPPCCRTWNAAGLWKSTLCWARWSSWQTSPGTRRRYCRAILALVRERARQAGCYPKD